MASKAKLTQADWDALIERADDLAQAMGSVEGRWPFTLSDPFTDLERAAQTLNRLAENIAATQRMVLATIALGADERRIRAELAKAE